MRTRWLISACAVVVALAASSGVALAQGRGHGRGRGNGGEPPGQAKKAEARFRDYDREYARNWYVHERRDWRDEGEDEGRGLPPGLRGRELPPGLRDRDRLPPGLEARLRPGFVFIPELRPELYPVPVVLLRTFEPPPPGFHYFLFGGHIVLLDPGYRLYDVIHLELNIGG